MEPIDPYCDPDQGVCWGPPSKAECMNLLQKNVHVNGRKTLGNTPFKATEDDNMEEHYKEELSSIISDVSKLSVQSKYYTPNETQQSQNTESFINKMTEILCEETNLTPAHDLSKKTAKSNSFITALDVSHNSSSLIDLTNSQSDDENLAGVLEDIIEKLNEDIQENTETLNETGKNIIDDKNEYSRYTCTQSKYDDISGIFEVDERNNMSQCLSNDYDEQNISYNLYKPKDISDVYEDNLKTNEYPKTALNYENISISKNQSIFIEDNEDDVSVNNSSDLDKETVKISSFNEVLYVSSDSSTNEILNYFKNLGEMNPLNNTQCKESETKFIKMEPLNYFQETSGDLNCSILEISSDLSLTNPEDDDTLSHSYEDNGKTEENLNKHSLSKVIMKGNEILLSRKSPNLMENKTILEETGTCQEIPVSNLVRDVGQSPFLNKSEINVSLGSESENNDSLGIIHLSMKNLEHTLFLNKTKVTPSDETNNLLNKFHESNIIAEDPEEESCSYSHYYKSSSTCDVNIEADIIEESDSSEGNAENTDFDNKLQHSNEDPLKPEGFSNYLRPYERINCISNNHLLFDYEGEHTLRNHSKPINENYVDPNISETTKISAECSSYEFNDTLDEINRALELGLDYSMSSQQSKYLAHDTPAKRPTSNITYKSQSARKPEKIKPFQSKLPISKYSHIISPISVYRNNPTTSKSSEFKKPTLPVTKRMSPASYFQKNVFPLTDIQSPVSHYIKNTPTTPLQQNVQTNRTTNKKLFTPGNTTKTAKENVLKLPSVIYKPASSTIISKEKPYKLPNKIEKLVPVKPDIIKHQGRLVKNSIKSAVVERKLMSNDLTIDLSMDTSTSATNDVSILTSKKAFIK